MTAVFLLPVTLLAGESLRVPTLHGWAVVVGLAVISHVGGQGLITYALGHPSASFSAVAMIAARFLFFEALRGMQLLECC